jgi:hypothetical protein
MIWKNTIIFYSPKLKPLKPGKIKPTENPLSSPLSTAKS